MIAASAGMLILIFDGQTALDSAGEGIQLCLQTLIPSLLPFFIFSVLLTGSLGGASMKLLAPLERLCRIPAGSGPLVLIGFLGGYPVGAQNVSLAWKNGQLSRRCAQRMLAFCSNAGPSFLFGIIGSMFPGRKYPWLLWLVHVAGALLVSFLLPAEPEGFSELTPKNPITFPQALERALRVMATVCGWVIFFRLILGFLDRWILWILPLPVRVLVKGSLELSNGCILLGGIENIGLRFLTAAVMLSFGGVCVAMQTGSVCDGLSLRSYYAGKLMQTGFSFLLALALQLLLPAKDRFSIPLWMIAAVAGAFLIGALRIKRQENSSSIPAAYGV